MQTSYEVSVINAISKLFFKKKLNEPHLFEQFIKTNKTRDHICVKIY